jgi:hypothetical protein
MIYLKGTLDFGIMYWKSEQDDLRGFTNFDWARGGEIRNS